MKKLRLYFAMFSILLALPIMVLVRHTYANLEEESFFFYRRAAEGLMATAYQQLQGNLQREEQRPYTHYRYIHVADQPVPQQEGLNLSPLASFPVQSEIPGILGYYQIDPDGSFHTPLLPDAPDENIVVPQREERIEVRDRIAFIVQGQTFHLSGGLREEEAQKKEKTATLDETAAALQRNLESNVDLRLEQEFDRKDSADTLGLSSEADAVSESPQYLERRVQKASPKQAEVFDSQFRNTYSEQSEILAEDAAAGNRLSGVRPATAAGRQNQPEEPRARDFDDRPTQEVVAEVDPFQTTLVNREWLVFYRKVWWHDRRYIQGFVTRFSDFLEAHLKPAFLNSALPATASHFLFYQGELMPTAPGEAASEKPLLLYSAAFPHPLSDAHVAVTVPALPKGPGQQLVNILAAFLSLLLIGGLAGIYRLTATQMELSQKKSDFVSAVSHELKTPLTAIRMYGEMLVEGWVEDEKKARYYQHIHDESERLSRLIQNVLTLAQLERKEWKINLKAHHPAEFVTSTVDRLRGQIERAGFEVVTVTEGELRPIQVDSDALTQILINLIDNAIKFSKDAETRKIVLKVSQLGEDCYIRVRDHGPGIPRRQLKRIFQKFYRLDSEMTRSTQGTGIGLSLVKMLADAMQVHVDVANRDPGVEFSLRFPTR